MSKKIIIATVAALLFSAVTGTSYSLFRPVKVYKPDAEAVEIPQMKLKSYIDSGWYDEPVRIMYHPDGNTICIAEKETEDYKSQGWFTEAPLLMYAPDGKTMYINSSERAAYEETGWYTEAVTLMYAADGRTMYVKNSEPEPETGRISARGSTSGGIPIFDVIGESSEQRRSVAPDARSIYEAVIIAATAGKIFMIISTPSAAPAVKEV